MPFGILEIAIVAVILFLIFGYKMLPSLGRKAGEGVNDLRGSVRDMVGDKADPKTLGRSAGKGVREMREFRDALTGKSDSSASDREPAPREPPAPPESEVRSEHAADPPEDEPERVEGEVVRDEPTA